MWTIRILLMHDGANLKSEIALPILLCTALAFSAKPQFLLDSANGFVLGCLRKGIAGPRSIFLRSFRNTVKKRKTGYDSFGVYSHSTSSCLLNESMGGPRPLCSLAVWSSLQAERALAAQPLAIGSFLLKFHYSYSCCSLLSNGLRKNVPVKLKLL